MKSSRVVLLMFPVAAFVHATELKVVESEKAITIARGEVPVLTYHKAEVDPPAGADPVYKRSGFIHPLCAPNGEPVTGTCTPSNPGP